jgi:RND family efflux transporter MFP subunit
VDEGTQAQAGDVLCELDRTDVLKEVQDLENRVIALRGEVTAATAELEIQLSENEGAIGDAELARRVADLEKKRWEEGELVQETSRRTFRVTESKSALARAEKRFAEMPDLLAEGFVTKEQVEEERILLEKAKNEVELAELDLANYLKYVVPKERAQKEADLRNAGLEVDREKQRAAAREAQRRSAVERQRSEFTNVTTRLEEARTTLANMVIRAPSPGLVVYGDTRNPGDDRQIKVGETVYSGQPFLTLPDLSDMLAVVPIHEADIARIKPGQTAYVTVETAREQSLEGKVVRVSPVAAQASMRWGDGVKRFNVEVALEGDLSALKLKPGITAKVEILVGELKGALAVPVQAVFSQRGAVHVFRRSGEGSERVAVKIEPGNTQFVVIASGLAEGDRILLYDPQAAGGSAVRSDDAAAKPAEPRKGNGKP